MLSGWKTYIGGAGLILSGLGGILHGDVSLVSGLTTISLGIVAVGGRAFGQKLLDLLASVKK